MSTQYGGNPPNFPSLVTLPSDGDGFVKAADVNVALEGIADRTIIAFADITALKAVNTSALPHGTWRFVVGLGVFIFDVNGSGAEVIPWNVAPLAGPGRWKPGVARPTSAITRVVDLVMANAGRALIDPASRGLGQIAFDPDLAVDIAYNRGKLFIETRNSGSSSTYAHYLSLNAWLLDGATLTGVVARYKPGLVHGALPQTMPAVGVFRAAKDTDSAVENVGWWKLLTTGVATDSSPDVATFDVAHAITYTPNQHNVIELATYEYFAILYDEGGTNSQDQFWWLGVDLLMTPTDRSVL